MNTDTIHHRLGKALQAAVPLLTEYAPPGWIDFREPMPAATLRRGLAIYLEEQPASGILRFKLHFAGELTCYLAINQLNLAVPSMAYTLHGFPVVSRSVGPIPWWEIEFSIRTEMAEELAEALTPTAFTLSDRQDETLRRQRAAEPGCDAPQVKMPRCGGKCGDAECAEAAAAALQGETAWPKLADYLL